jgi:hypothetical protein
MTEHEKIKLQSLNILKNGVISKNNKCNKYKKNHSSVLYLPRHIQFNSSQVSNSSISNFFQIEENKLNSESIEIYSKLKYHSLNKFNIISKGKRILNGSNQKANFYDDAVKKDYII